MHIFRVLYHTVDLRCTDYPKFFSFVVRECKSDCYLLRRGRVTKSRRWVDENPETIDGSWMDICYQGGIFGGNIKPTPLLCLMLKMLVCKRRECYMYLRLTCSSNETCESDATMRDGSYGWVFIDELLREGRACDIMLPWIKAVRAVGE